MIFLLLKRFYRSVVGISSHTFFLPQRAKKTAKNDISGTGEDGLLFPDMSFLISENVHHIPENVVFCCLSVSSGSEIFHFFAQQFAHDEVCQP